MFKIEWKKGENYPIFNDKTKEPINSPRPVFYEEFRAEIDNIEIG